MKSIFKVFLPTVFAYLMFAMTNIVDAIFVGNLYGTAGQTAMGLVSPVVVIVTCVIFSIVVGTNTYLGHAIGEKKEEEANKIFNHTLLYGIIILTIFELLIFLIVIPIITTQIKEPEVIRYYLQYITLFLPSLIVMYIAVVLSFTRRLIGDVNVAFKAGMISLFVNILFNFCFALILDFGIRGIAMASLLSYICQVLYIYNVYRKENQKMFKPKIYKFDYKLMSKVFFNGLSDGIFDLSNAIVQVMNIILLTIFIGDISASYLYVLNSILILQLMIFFSLSDSLNPLISVEYGKKDFKKIEHIRNNALIISLCLGVVIYIIILNLKPYLFTLFGIHDVANRLYLFKYSNIYFLVIFIFGINQTFTAYLTAIGWSKLSLFIGVMRNIIIIIFVTCTLTYFFGEVGLWSSYFVSEVISFTFIVTILVVIKPLKREIKKNLS